MAYLRSRILTAPLLLTIASMLATNAIGAEIHLLELTGAIGPASSDHFVRSLASAEDGGAEAFVLRLDTPGGLDASMRDMVKAILDARIPVVTWVAPSGSRAASAGTYILYASHVAAMAPATNLGAATPVAIGGGLPLPGAADDPAGDLGSDGDEGAAAKRSTPTPASAMERKAINDAVAYIRGLAQLRGRNVEWAEEAVRGAAALSATEALAAGVVDLIAADLPELQRSIDGREIELASGSVTLATADASVQRVEADWRHEFLTLVTDPNIAYILLMIGIYGLILEFYNPGLGIPGITGVICLLLGAYALQMLPVSYAGLGLIIVGIALMVAEAFSPSFGVLGLGGAAAFVVGSVLLFDTELPAYRISRPLIAAFAASSVLVCVGTVVMALRASRQHAVSGREAMIGAPAEALTDFRGMGQVRVAGEHWQAHSDEALVAGQQLRVRDLHGLVVEVEAVPSDQTEESR